MNEPNSKIKTVERIAAELRQLFPDKHTVTLNVSVPGGSCELSLFATHQHWKYAEAQAELQELGVGKREKHVHEQWTTLRGIANGSTVEVIAHPDELPPSCRKVKYLERIPKTQTIDTGEFIEVEKEKIVCGEDK